MFHVEHHGETPLVGMFHVEHCAKVAPKIGIAFTEALEVFLARSDFSPRQMNRQWDV
jgi:hypothetical protein